MTEPVGSSAALAALAPSVAAVVGAVPGVVRLWGGHAGEIATYLPGSRVTGVRVSSEGVEVHLVAAWVSSLPRLAEEVRAALDPVVAGRTVSVYIEDLEAETLPPGTPRAIGDGAWATTEI